MCAIINIPFIALLLQGIPEQIAVVTLAFVIARIPLKWEKIIMSGIILAFVSYAVRIFTISFGLHTILLIVLLFIALTWLGKGDFSLSLIASLLSFLALVIVEFVCLSLLMPVFGVTPEKLFPNLVIRIVITEPQVFLIFICAFLLNKFMKTRWEV
ncbi:hypothetical protein [Desulfosporosinus sp.]|uniref:hypothetical protein n=1 Tax=Desulfosporosinus sp. TaxID=157907 RepID=UPI00231AFCCF|nr:hypothetical protein [Desulfosporosinus sp.]MCO5385023.1 hypothetical protein [Desulfosporosinus sp.]MDA8222387.1 hypothetical protein [Desulfitobacterium hafniense]